jgi:adenylosuccinate synthase
MMTRKPITIVVGGQYGSEAKGAIAAYLCLNESVDYAIRTGATNAGHTVEYRDRRYAMQQLPVGWVNPKTALVIGAGALINPAILVREIDNIKAATGVDPRSRIYIDPRAYIHRTIHAARSAESGRHHGIGATGKGCSEALIDRIRLRGGENWTVEAAMVRGGTDAEPFAGCNIVDTEEMLNNAVDNGDKLLLEGCQGTLLDLVLGPYPYTTHKQTTPAQWMSEVGLSPALGTDIVMVLRTFPIRVAGNSGPMGAEMSWPQLARRINGYRSAHALASIVPDVAISGFENAVREAAKKFDMPIRGDYGPSDGLDMHEWNPNLRQRYQRPLSELHREALKLLPDGLFASLMNLFEMTTVTQKLRRIANITHYETSTAIRQVRPHRIAVTFMNYVFPHLWHSVSPITDAECTWLYDNIGSITPAPILAINRGPAMKHILPVA